MLVFVDTVRDISNLLYPYIVLLFKCRERQAQFRLYCVLHLPWVDHPCVSHPVFLVGWPLRHVCQTSRQAFRPDGVLPAGIAMVAVDGHPGAWCAVCWQDSSAPTPPPGSGRWPRGWPRWPSEDHPVRQSRCNQTLSSYRSPPSAPGRRR
jgi:hypothetical protein